MAVSSNAGVFNLGKDATIVLVGPNGQVDLPNVMKFSSKPVYKDIEVDCLNGISLSAAIPKHWEGTFELYRANDGLDTLFAQQEVDWFASGILRNSDLYLYVSEADGSQSVFHYSACTLKFENPGEWATDDSVKLTVSLRATKRLQIS